MQSALGGTISHSPRAPKKMESDRRAGGWEGKIEVGEKIGIYEKNETGGRGGRGASSHDLELHFFLFCVLIKMFVPADEDSLLLSALVDLALGTDINRVNRAWLRLRLKPLPAKIP